MKVKRFPGKIIEELIKRTAAFYILAAIFLGVFVNVNLARANYLNSFRESEDYLQRFADGKQGFDERKFKDCVFYYQKLAKFLPLYKALAYGNLGFCYFYLNDFAKSIEYYKKAVKDEPGLYTLYLDLSEICLKLNDFKSAAKLLYNCLLMIPTTEDSYGELAKSLTQKGRNDLSLQVQGLILSAKEDYAEANDRLGYVFYVSKNYNDALSYFKEAIALNPENIQAYYYHYLCLRALGKKEEYARDAQMILIMKKKYKIDNSQNQRAIKLHLNIKLMKLQMGGLGEYAQEQVSAKSE